MKKLFVILALMCTTKEKFQTWCEATCFYDGDEKAVVIDGECFCANKRDVCKQILRLENVKGRAIVRPTWVD